MIVMSVGINVVDHGFLMVIKHKDLSHQTMNVQGLTLVVLPQGYRQIASSLVGSLLQDASLTGIHLSIFVCGGSIN